MGGIRAATRGFRQFLRRFAIMKSKLIFLSLSILLLCAFSPASDAPKPAATPATHELTMDMVAKIKVGTTTGDQLKEMLGMPWRTNNYGDCNPIDYQESWEYLGRDAGGTFKITVIFDEAHVARIVGKTPAQGPTVTLAAAPKPEHPHQH
jgi:outer membrane protein assembly factor BamE (lipoprotein component of BamABCDE complex)